MPWWHWPSIVTEIVGGVALVTFIRFSPKNLLYVAAAATVVSAAYEYGLDAHGWSWKDVGQRELGIVGGVILLKIVIPVGHEPRRP